MVRRKTQLSRVSSRTRKHKQLREQERQKNIAVDQLCQRKKQKRKKQKKEFDTQPAHSSSQGGGSEPTATSQSASDCPPPNMSLDRARQRDFTRWDHPPPLFHEDNFCGPNYSSFDQQWGASQRGNHHFSGRNNYGWMPQGSHGRHHSGSSGSGYEQDNWHFQQGGHRGQPWGSQQSQMNGRGAGQAGNASHRGMAKPSLMGNPPDRRPGSAQELARGGKNGSGGNQWDRLAKQFSNSHFHREEAGSTEGELNNSSFGESPRTEPADSSGLEDSWGSGSRKRPLSLDREGSLSKSSRAESSSGAKSSDPLGPDSSRALSLTDLSGRNVERPDSTSRQRPAGSKGGQKAIRPGTGPPGKQGAAAAGKKKAMGPKSKMGDGQASKAAAAGSKSDKLGGEDPGEGVLERAERMCLELREKRRQAAHVRAASGDHPPPARVASSGQRVAALRNALNTSTRQFNLVHKSFLKLSSDPSASATATATSTAAAAGVAPASAPPPKKHFSSSTSSAESHTSKPKRAPKHNSASLHDSQSSGVAVSTVSSSSSQTPVGDIERIRSSIESSVRAEGRVSRPPGRRHSASVPSPVATAAAKKKAPLALSKDALAMMVSAPRSRTQRVQLARMLRQHSAVAPVAQPRRIQLDGLYDDGDSIEDVLRNLSGLEEIGDCAELKNIKLEDLTTEDKLTIAQLIEDVDVRDRGEHLPYASSDLGLVSLQQHETEGEVRITVDSSPPPRGRLQAASPTPSRPLSLDDLHTELAQPRVVTLQSPAAARTSLMRSRTPSPAPPPPSGVQSPLRSTPPVPRSPPRSAQMRSLSPAVLFSGESGHSSGGLGYMPAPDPMETTAHTQLTEGRTTPQDRSARTVDLRPSSPLRSPAPVPMDVSEAPRPSSAPRADASLPSGSVGVLHEVMSLCQQQDTAVAEMRHIDVELSQMYRSLIEIVARMSGLQRRRVQLQSEGEDISRRRNHLLSGTLVGLSPDVGDSLGAGSSSASGERSQQHFAPSAPSVPPPPRNTLHNIPPPSDPNYPSDDAGDRESTGGSAPGLPVGSSVTLPSWLAAPSTTTSDRERSSWRRESETEPSTAGDPTSDVCLSGSVTSSVGSLTPRAEASHRTSFRSSVDSVREAALSTEQAEASSGNLGGGVASSALKSSSRPSSRERVMLSVSGRQENREGGESVGASANAGLCGETTRKNSLVESSSGVGSSIDTVVTGGGGGGGQKRSERLDSSSTVSSVTSSLGRPPTGGGEQQHNNNAGPSSSSRLLFNSFSSPPQPPNPRGGGAQSPGPGPPQSPGVSVAYLGSLSSDLVQQIVRNLPRTSQLGERGAAPSMFMLKPGACVMGSPTGSVESARSRQGSTDESLAGKLRTRTSSLSMAGDVESREGLAAAAATTAKSRVRTSSLHSVAGDVLSPRELEQQSFSASVPPLRLHSGGWGGGGEGGGGGSNTCTPRSESDAYSVTSGTSLGEQIKQFSERNHFDYRGQDHFDLTLSDDDDGAAVAAGESSRVAPRHRHHADLTLTLSEDTLESPRVRQMANCSVVLEKMDLEKLARPKRFKTKKDRNQDSFRHKYGRRPAELESSTSDGESGDSGSLPDFGPGAGFGGQRVSSASPSGSRSSQRASRASPLTTGSSRGVQRGDSPGSSRGVQRSESPGSSRGVQRGESPGSSRGVQRVESPASSRGVQRGESPGSSRAVQRGSCASPGSSRGVQRGDSPGSSRGVQRGSCESLGSSRGVQRMEADCSLEDGGLDRTLVDERGQLDRLSAADSMSDGGQGAAGDQGPGSRPISPSRLVLDPDHLAAFRANVQRNMEAPAGGGDLALPETSVSSSGEASLESPWQGWETPQKAALKVVGPCTPVMGLQVHGDLLYVGFQGKGVKSYTMEGQLVEEYSLETAQCFTVMARGKGGRDCLAVGTHDQLVFLRGAVGSAMQMDSRLCTQVKVMCLLMVDALLFAGTDVGIIIVVNLDTLQEVRRFQASDVAVHCMTWTREGSTRLLLAAAQDACIHVLDAASGLPVRAISSHTKTAFTLCMSDHLVFSGSGDRRVMVHNVHTAALTWELPQQKGMITSVCVDSGLLFSSGYCKTIHCYDIKTRKLRHMLYGAGKSIVMRMIVHNSVLYSGNRDGQVEALDLNDLGSFPCECEGCDVVLGVKDHLWHHLVADHLLPNAQAMRCPWRNCLTMLNTGISLGKAGEHMRSHISGDLRHRGPSLEN